MNPFERTFRKKAGVILLKLHHSREQLEELDAKIKSLNAAENALTALDTDFSEALALISAQRAELVESAAQHRGWIADWEEKRQFLSAMCPHPPDALLDDGWDHHNDCVHTRCVICDTTI